MMSAGKGAMAANGEQYYYQRDPMIPEDKQNGQWVGKGAQALGLEGNVQKEDFSAALRGQDPQTGEQLVEVKNKGVDPADRENPELRRAYNDYTFSAPKSVSVAHAAGVTGIKEAHDAAVLKVAEYMEAHHSQARVDGRHVNGSFVAAKYDHMTSRALDPQLHSHLVTMNMTQTPDGKWRANDPKNVFADQKILGLMYRQELATELTKAGFELEWTDREQMFFEVKGVDERLIEAFSQRREQIEQQVSEWKTAGMHKGLPDAKLYEMAALGTRSSKDKDLTREQVEGTQKEIYDRAGSSPEKVKESVEAARQQNIQKQREQQARQEEKAESVVNEATRILTDKEAVIDRSQLMRTSAQISGGKHSIDELSDAIDKHAVRLGQDEWGREHYTTQDIRTLEAKNAARLQDLPAFQGLTSKSEVEAYLSKLERTEGVKLSAGQRNLVINELSGTKGLAVVQGDPGTGKTFASSIVERFNNEVLKPSGREHHTLNVAFTGKAASEMAEASGQPAYTIDSFLNAYHKRKISVPQGAQVVLKVDEASFVGARQAKHLLNVVNDLQAQGIQTKLELVGDTKQMQAIQAGDFFRQAQGKGDFAALKEINRQKDNPELLKVAETLNRDGNKYQLGDNAREALAMLQQQGRVTEISDRDELVKATVDRYISEAAIPARDAAKAAAGEKQSVLLVTSLNRDRLELNQAIRTARVEAGQIEQGKTYQVQVQANTGPTAASYKPGQQIQFTGFRAKDGQMRSWGAPLQSVGVVQSVNPDKNTVRVAYAFQRDGKPYTVTNDFKAEAMQDRVAAYNQEERQFSAGDRLVFLKNDKELGVKNGQMGEIIKIDNKGNVTVKMDAWGTDKTFNLGTYNNVDHGYAVTTEKSQGATVDSMIQFANVREDGKGARESYNGLNVAVTRARHESHIMTTSIQGMEKATERVDEKTTTLGRSVEDVPDRDASRELSDSVAGLKADLQQAKSHNSRDKTPTDSLSQSVADLRREIEQAKGGTGRDSDHHQEHQHEASRTAEITNTKELE